VEDEDDGVGVVVVGEEELEELIDAAAATDGKFHARVLASHASQLDSLAPVIIDHYSRKAADDGFRYLYFNHMNLALKTSINKKATALPKEVMKLLTELHSEFERSPESVCEVMLKLSSDGWIVGRKSDRRELFVVIEGRSANLIDATEEIRKLSMSHFGNIFIEDWT